MSRECTKIKQKLYCYVDETGQDAGSDFFIVVVVISDKHQDAINQQLINIEFEAGVLFKWKKTALDRNKRYLQMVLEREIAKSGVYFIRVKKPVPYFTLMLRILEKAILDQARGHYKATIYIDGIDKKNARALTNALREFGIHIKSIRTVRDESNSLIRLADRWAGCIRKAYENREEEKKIFEYAKRQKYLKQIK